MSDYQPDTDPANWDPALDAVVAAPKNHRVVENESVSVLEVTLEPGEEEPTHHHRWPSFSFSIKCKIRSMT